MSRGYRTAQNHIEGFFLGVDYKRKIAAFLKKNLQHQTSNIPKKVLLKFSGEKRAIVLGESNMIFQPHEVESEGKGGRRLRAGQVLKSLQKCERKTAEMGEQQYFRYSQLEKEKKSVFKFA